MRAIEQRVVLLGDINIDVILHVDRYPEMGGDARSERMTIQVGGSAANTSVVLRRLSVPCALIAAVGQDHWARQALEALQSVDIDTGLVASTDADQTGLMFVPVAPGGERTLFGRRGANRKLRIAGAEQASIAEASLLHVSGYAFYEDPQLSSARNAMDHAVRSGTPICLDTAYGPAIEHPERLRTACHCAQILIVGEQEAMRITGTSSVDRATHGLHGLGPRWIALKRGSRGVLLLESGRTIELPADNVTVVDTTGAGDAFSAGMIYGWLQGWSIGDSGLLSVILGGMGTAVNGLGLAFPHSAEILEALLKPARPSPFSERQRKRMAFIARELAAE